MPRTVGALARRFVATLRAGAAGMAVLLCLLTVAGSPGQAQDFRFTQFTVEGNQRIESATILTYAGLAPGEPVGPGAVNDAYQRILDTGLFEEVEVIPQGAQLLIRVREYPTINIISFEGNQRIDDDTLRAVITSQPRRVYSPATAEADAAILARAYAESGRYSAEVRPVIIRRPDNRVDLVFEVREGRPVEIERISFVGNRSFSEYRLRRILQTKQAGLLRSIIRRDTFVADRIDFDIQLLTDFYNARGYIDFEVLSVASELAENRDAFFLVFNLREGQQFRLGTISIGSALPGINPRAYGDEIRIRPGMIYSPLLIDETIARLERLAIQEGRDFIRVDPVITRNDAERTLDVEFQIVEGERIFIERIDIEGNTTTLDRVIRNQFRVVEGDPFNPREIRQAAARIRALGFFETAEVNAREGTRPETVIVDVDVVEQPTGQVDFGLNYSTDLGLGLAIGFSERNFLGRGQSFRFRFDTSSTDNNSVLSWAEPAFLDRDLTLGGSIYYNSTSTDVNANYDTSRLGFTPYLEFPLGEFSRLNLRYRLSNDSVSKVSDNSSPIIQADDGSRVTSLVGYTYSYDTRRRGLDPNAGVVIEFAQGFAGLGGDETYIRTTALFGAERRLRNEDIALRATFEAGSLNSFSEDSRLTERYFLSTRQMRGFEPRGLGPRDLASVNQDTLGGNYFAVARFEVDFPLGLPEEYGISGGLFYDIGSVWGLDNKIGADGVPVDDGLHWRQTAGFAIYWDTFLGPLRFNFTTPIQVKPYDTTRNFDFTIATQF
jgi:outer membrane protein insertion porin family